MALSLRRQELVPRRNLKACLIHNPYRAPLPRKQARGQDHQPSSVGPQLLYPLHLSKVTRSMESPQAANLHQVDREQASFQRHKREEHRPIVWLQGFLVQQQQVLLSLSKHPARLEHLQSTRVRPLLELRPINQDPNRRRLEHLQSIRARLLLELGPVNQDPNRRRLEHLRSTRVRLLLELRLVNQDPRPPLLALKLLRQELRQVCLEPHRPLLEPSTRQVPRHLRPVLASLQLFLSTAKEAHRPLLECNQRLLRSPKLLQAWSPSHRLMGKRDLTASSLLVPTPSLRKPCLRVSSLKRRHPQLRSLRARQQQAFLLNYHMLLRPQAELHSNHPTPL